VYVQGSISTFFPFNLDNSASVITGTGYTGFIFYNKLQYGMAWYGMGIHICHKLHHI